jgi:hypothetical protein
MVGLAWGASGIGVFPGGQMHPGGVWSNIVQGKDDRVFQGRIPDGAAIEGRLRDAGYPWADPGAADFGGIPDRRHPWRTPYRRPSWRIQDRRHPWPVPDRRSHGASGRFAQEAHLFPEVVAWGGGYRNRGEEPDPGRPVVAPSGMQGGTTSSAQDGPTSAVQGGTTSSMQGSTQSSAQGGRRSAGESWKGVSGTGRQDALRCDRFLVQGCRRWQEGV